MEKIALFIDGPNLYTTAKTLGFDIDYKRLLKEFQSRGNLVRAFYYTAIIEDQEYSSIRPLVDWLDYNGYTVVTKPTKEFIDSNGRRKVKGNMDVEIAVDVMELAGHVDQIVLSGDRPTCSPISGHWSPKSVGILPSGPFACRGKWCRHERRCNSGVGEARHHHPQHDRRRHHHLGRRE
jgi:hypothetical protein